MITLLNPIKGHSMCTGQVLERIDGKTGAELSKELQKRWPSNGDKS